MHAFELFYTIQFPVQSHHALSSTKIYVILIPKMKQSKKQSNHRVSVLVVVKGYIYR